MFGNFCSKEPSVLCYAMFINGKDEPTIKVISMEINYR